MQLGQYDLVNQASSCVVLKEKPNIAGKVAVNGQPAPKFEAGASHQGDPDIRTRSEHKPFPLSSSAVQVACSCQKKQYLPGAHGTRRPYEMHCSCGEECSLHFLHQLHRTTVYRHSLPANLASENYLCFLFFSLTRVSWKRVHRLFLTG